MSLLHSETSSKLQVGHPVNQKTPSDKSFYWWGIALIFRGSEHSEQYSGLSWRSAGAASFFEKSQVSMVEGDMGRNKQFIGTEEWLLWKKTAVVWM